MTARRIVQALLTGWASAALLGQPALALINLDGGRNKINLSGGITYGYDSNLFASAGGEGDTFANATISVDLSRHAGLIGVDAGVGLSANRYGEFSGENFQNPEFHAQFDKSTGRTQGTLSLSAARQSRADTAANLRNESWAYSAALALNYRVIERYSLKPTFTYALTDFTDNSIAVDLSSYALGLDLFYIYSATRDLLASYRFRIEETSLNTNNYDHSFSLGMSGKIFSGFTGQVRAGYEIRIPSLPGESPYHAWTANANMGWKLTRRLDLTAQLAKDFSTTSTNLSVDALATTIGAGFVINAKTSASASTTWSHSRFLGALANGRRDNNWTANLALARTIKSTNRGTIKGAVSYIYARNTSTESIAQFDRSTATATVSSSF